MTGQTLLDEVNTIRAIRGLPSLRRIRLAGSDPEHPSRCPIALATGTSISAGTAPELQASFAVRFAYRSHARMAAAELDLPFCSMTREMQAPPAIRDFVNAAFHHLVFDDGKGDVRGWISPRDDNPSTWDLHLMPEHAYPPGHAPRLDPPHV
jgi:hypothetical protein